MCCSCDVFLNYCILSWFVFSHYVWSLMRSDLQEAQRVTDSPLPSIAEEWLSMFISNWKPALQCHYLCFALWLLSMVTWHCWPQVTVYPGETRFIYASVLDAPSLSGNLFFDLFSFILMYCSYHNLKLLNFSLR